MDFVTELMLGATRKKVTPLVLRLADIRNGVNGWCYRVNCDGAIQENRVLEGNSSFDCMVLGMAFLRQALRTYLAENPSVKIFEDIDGSLERVEIEDVFWVHDCVKEE